jgi:hypothetical protein
MGRENGQGAIIEIPHSRAARIPQTLVVDEFPA